jgi:single-strand DNA-binding protein
MVNKAILIGHVGQDPEIRSVNGKEMCSFSVATSEKWKDKTSGEKKESTTWHRVVCFQEGLVGIVKAYVKKGSKLYIEGTITVRKWDDNGVEKTAHEINIKSAGKIVLLDSQKRDGNPPDAAYTEDQQ